MCSKLGPGDVDLWTTQVRAWNVAPAPKPKIRKYVGSCCEYNVGKAKKKAVIEEYNAMCKEKKRLDGALQAPEFGLLVDSPFQCTDILGLGAC